MALLVVALSARAGEAQVTVDGTLGPARNLAGPHYAIGAELGQVRGPNLFHSFGQFNLAAGESATFSGPADIRNVLGRVTGGAASVIDGAVRSSMAGANLFLINPAGLVFGPNASLDVGGSFHASTADSIRLGADGVFPASAAVPARLTVAPPTAFGFLGSPPAPIRVQGSALALQAGRSLSLTGGDVDVRGGAQVRAPGGRVDLVALAAAGELAFDAAAQRPVLAPGAFSRLGRVRLSEGSLVTARGDPGGSVAIRAGRLTVDGGAAIVAATGDLDGASPAIDLEAREAIALDDGRLLSFSEGRARAGDVLLAAPSVAMLNGSFVATSPIGPGTGGDLLVTAGRVDLDGATLTSGTTGLAGMGRSGNIAIEATDVTVTGGTQIDSSSQGPGQGGAVTVAAARSLTVSGRDPGTDLPSQISAQAGGAGAAGRVEIRTPALTLDGGRIATQSLGAGRAGDAMIDVDRLTLLADASISSAALETGAGGTIRIRAREAVALLGAATSISSFASPTSAGAGDIAIAAPTVLVAGGAILAATQGPAPGGSVALDVGTLRITGGGAIDSSTFGAGRGGAVTVTAAELIAVEGRDARGVPSGITSSTTGGSAGRIALTAPTVSLDGGGTIGVFSSGGASVTGDAGTAVLAVNRLLVTGGSRIDASTDSAGAGGSIEITAREQVVLSGPVVVSDPDASRATAIRSVSTNAGPGGRIVIRAPALTVDGALVVTRAVGTGPAGAIAIEVDRLVLVGAALVDSTTFGPARGGDIAIRAAEAVSVTGSVVLAGTIGRGPAGHIAITAPRVDLTGGAAVSALTLGDAPGGDIALRARRLSITGGALVDSTTRLGAGAGGNVTARASERIDLVSGRIATSAAGAGPGGTIVLEAPRIALARGSRIEATSAAAGDAGDIRLRAGGVFTSRDSQVTTSAEVADGGNVAIAAGDLVHLVDSQVTAAVRSGVGRGGNVSIDPRFVVLDGAEVRADAFGGPGGNVAIVAGVFLASPDSVVSASSALGLPGVVDVRAEVTEVSGRLSRLPETELRAAELLRQACAARYSGGARQVSTLVLAGPAIPPDPGGALSTSPAEPGVPLARVSVPEPAGGRPWRAVRIPGPLAHRPGLSPAVTCPR